MKQFALLIIVIFSICLLAAQDIQPWQFVRHSASDNNGQVHVRFNGTPDVLGDYELFNWQGNTWQNVTLSNPEPLLYEALLPYSYGQDLEYRLKTSYSAVGQTIAALNPAFLSSGTFPPVTDNLAYISDDPVGDSITAYFPNLDITGDWFGFTDTNLYSAMSNVTSTFPTTNTLGSYNIYFAGMASSATQLMNSSLYVMLYTVNLPGLISPGLYKINFNLADTTLTYVRLGNIQAQVAGGKLNLACNIADLTADPDFGSWPTPNNSMGFMAATLRLDIDLTLNPTFTIGDFSNIAQLIFEHHHYQVTQNTLPVISEVALIQNDVDFNLQMTYTDANQDFPLVAKVVLNTPLELALFPDVQDFSQPVHYQAVLPLIGWSTAQIQISDNNIDIVTYDLTNTAVEDDYLPELPFCKIYPNPFNPANGNLSIVLGKEKVTHASGSVYNLKGQLVKTLAGNGLETNKTMVWDGLTENGTTAVDGVYLLKINQDSSTISKKIMLIR